MAEVTARTNIIGYEPTKPLSVVLVMVCIYIFLVIERPWESVRYLEGIPIERVFAVVMIIVAFMSHRFKIISSPTNKWVYGLLLLHFILAPFAFSPGDALDQGIEYAKMVVLYLLMLAVADDEESLKILVKVFVFSMIFYMLHSLWEYHNGRLRWTMGISRMLGVGVSHSDPNSFSASLVYAIPFVYVLLRYETARLYRSFYYAYFALAVLCVVLTGSRTASIALVALLLVWGALQRGKLKFVALAAVVISLGVIWGNMPEEKQERIRTLWDKDAGPANAHQSAEGRMVGFKVSWKMFKQSPLTGVGAGSKNFIGYRMANNIDEEGQASPTASHVLYGEVLAELGVGGAILFTGLILTTFRCCWLARSQLHEARLSDNFSYALGGAIIASMLLLLLFGFGGHNFYRPHWLWLAAWAGTLLKFQIRGKCNSL